MIKEKGDDVLIISKEVYLALGPFEQMAAQAFQKVGKVRALYEDPRFKDLECLK